jgi:hypothetical protein
MSDGTIIHFGLDDCHRILVLTNAGYTVHSCTSLSQLRAALLGLAEVDAVVLTESDEFIFDEASSLIESNCGAPVVLFEAQPEHSGGSDVDLSVSGLISPEIWLEQIRELIHFSHTLPSNRKPARSETRSPHVASKQAS